MNAKSKGGWTAWHEACFCGQTETAQLIIHNSNDFGIDLNAKDNFGRPAWHMACWNGQIETVQLILKNWKEFGIDIKARKNEILERLKYEREGDEFEEITKMLENTYSQIDIT